MRLTRGGLMMDVTVDTGCLPGVIELLSKETINNPEFKAAVERAGIRAATLAAGDLRAFHMTYQNPKDGSINYLMRMYEAIRQRHISSSTSPSGKADVVGYMPQGKELIQNTSQQTAGIYLLALKTGVGSDVIHPPTRGGKWAKKYSAAGNVYDRLGQWALAKGWTPPKGNNPTKKLGIKVARIMEDRGIQKLDVFGEWYQSRFQAKALTNRIQDIYKTELQQWLGNAVRRAASIRTWAKRKERGTHGSPGFMRRGRFGPW